MSARIAKRTEKRLDELIKPWLGEEEGALSFRMISSVELPQSASASSRFFGFTDLASPLKSHDPPETATYLFMTYESLSNSEQKE